MDDSLISRQTAIDALNEYFERIGKLKRRGLTKGEKAISLDTVGTIKTLPSAQPERKEGHWIPHEGIDGDIQYECSRCGVLWEFNDGTPEDNEAYFCPKCGKKLITK